MIRKFGVFAAVALAALTVGYWFGSERSALAKDEKIFELRTYTTNEGKLPDLEKRFREHTIAIFDRHEMRSIGYWIPADAPRSENTLIYVLAHPDREAAKRHWAEFSADPEWKQVAAASEANGKIVTHVESVFMTAADFSPIR